MRARGTAALLATVWLTFAAIGRGEDWPQFRGPERHGTSSERNLLPSWAPGQPRELWRRELGPGYSAISVVGERLYTMATIGEEETVVCLDARTGETLWEAGVGASKVSELGDTGPRSTPTVDDGMVYAASSAGALVALSADDGGIVWTREHEGEPPRFGYAVSPLIDGDRLIVESGGTAQVPGVLALDKRSGELLWSALEGPAGYSSPIAVEIGGVRQYVFFRRVGNQLVSLSTEGELLWSHPTAALAVITTPIFHPPDRIFVASADDAFGGAMLRVRQTAGLFEVEEIWSERLMRNHFNSSVLVDGHLYGFDNGTFRCLDAQTGERRWAKRGFGKGSLVAAGGLLIVLSDGGTLALVEATPEAYRELGRSAAMTGRAWTAPSLADGRIYLRDFDEIVGFEASAPEVVDPAVAEVVERYLVARGGAERWREARSLELRGIYAAFSDHEPFTLVRRPDHLYRLDFTILGAPAVRARDEDGPWWRHPLLRPEPSRLEAGPYKTQVERESLFAPLLLDYADYGVGVELVGPSEVDGIPVTELRVTLADGSEERWYLDAETSLEVAVDSQVNDYTQSAVPMRQRVFFDDFREVGGLVIPFRIDYEFGHRLESMMVEQAFVDSTIDPATFRLETPAVETVEVPEEPPPSPPRAAEEAPAEPEPTPPAEPAPPRCGTLNVLDTNGDGRVSGADRYWRYLSLWKDDGDGSPEDAEVRSLYRHDVRHFSARLYSYTTAKDADRGVWVEEAIYFDLPGRKARAALAIDAGRLARGGELWLEDSTGARLDGLQVLRSGLTWVGADGERTDVLCN